MGAPGSEKRVKGANVQFRIEPEIMSAAVTKCGGKSAFLAAVRAHVMHLADTDGNADPATALSKKLNDIGFVIDRESAAREARDAQMGEQIDQIKKLGAIIAKNDIARKSEIERVLATQNEIVKVMSRATADASKTAAEVAAMAARFNDIDGLMKRFQSVMEGLAAVAEGEQ